MRTSLLSFIGRKSTNRKTMTGRALPRSSRKSTGTESAVQMSSAATLRAPGFIPRNIRYPYPVASQSRGRNRGMTYDRQKEKGRHQGKALAEDIHPGARGD